MAASRSTREDLGYFFEFGEEADAAALAQRDELADQLVNELLAWTTPLADNEFLCCQRLIDSPGLPERHAVELQRWLLRMAEGVIATIPAAWSGYVSAAEAAPNCAASWASRSRHILPANLDYVIQSQNNDGSWSPPWSWFGKPTLITGRKPNASGAGVLTLERLEWLHAVPPDRTERLIGPTLGASSVQCPDTSCAERGG